MTDSERRRSNGHQHRPAGSPITGWDRSAWLSVADRLLLRIRDFASPGHARPRLPGPVTADGEVREGMETICRSLLLAASRLAGAEQDRLGHAAWYREAILAGTDVGGPEAWPRAVTCRTPLQGITQSLVEAANLAFALHIGRRWLWDPMSGTEQDQVADWLAHHARLEAWENNWQLFPALCEGFLRSVGRATPGGDLTPGRNSRGVARVESWYLGDGWYTDGPEHAIDYYNAWTIHPFLWAWYGMTDRQDMAEAKGHRDRLAAFARGFPAFVTEDGSLLHLGRSLVYRTAALAALWCAELAGVNPWTPGQTRRLASGVLSRFLERGAGGDDLLGPGWYGDHPGTLQSYSGFGSPYLAGIGFLGLALPADHPVWAAAEEPLPTDHGGHRLSLPGAGWNVTNTGDLTRLTNHGSDHCALPVGAGPDPDDPHYAKFSFSSHTAPGTGQAFADNIDGHLALVDSAGRATRRCALRGSRVEGAVSGSVHLPQLDGTTLIDTAIITVSIDHGPYELRCHLVTGRRGYTVREGGHLVADDHQLGSGVDEATTTGWVRNSEQTFSAVTALIGWETLKIHEYQGCSALGQRSAVVALAAPCTGEPQVFVALHTLTRTPVDVGSLHDEVTARVDGTTVTARWSDETEPISVDLARFVTTWDGHLGGRRG